MRADRAQRLGDQLAQLRVAGRECGHARHVALAVQRPRLRDQLAQLRVAGGEGGHPRHVALAVQRPRLCSQLLERRGHRGGDPAAKRHRVAAGRERGESVADDPVGQDRGGRRSVTGFLARAQCDLAQHLHAHVLERVGQLQLLCHGDAVARDRGHQAVRAVEHHAPATRPERDAHGGRKLVDPPPQRAAGVLVEADAFAHS